MLLREQMREASVLVLLGIAIGTGLTLATGRLLASQLFGVTSADPATIAMGAGIMLVVALTAAYLPARRAVRADPLIALRQD